MEKILINTGPSRRGWHRLESALKCPQFYAWSYLSGGVFGNRRPLVRGSLVHVGLAHFYARKQAEQEGADPECYYEPMEAIAVAAAQFGELGISLRELAQRMVGSYIREHGRERLKVLAVEREAEAQVSDRGRGPYLFTQRHDLIVEDGGGLVWIWDHKSCAKIESKTFQRYTLSGQVLALQWFGRALYGSRFGGVRLNVIAEDGRCERVSPDPAPALLGRFPQIICDAEGLIQLYADRPVDEWPTAASEAVCMGPYGPCAAWSLCQWGVGELQPSRVVNLTPPKVAGDKTVDVLI